MSEMREWLDLAAAWRAASLLMQAPTEQVSRQLAGLILELPQAQRSALEAMPIPDPEVWQTEYHDVLGPAGIPACESSYDTSAMAGRGPLLAQVSGYYQAFAYRPDPEAPETPDHASVELAFLSYLALKVAFSIYQGGVEERRTTEEAHMKFLAEHPRYWMEVFLERVAGAGSSWYQGAAAWISQLLFADLAHLAIGEKRA